MKSYDFIAIGGGGAGISAASLVKRTGRRVAVVDHGAVGGLCALNGCNPKKVLVRSSEVLDEIRRAGEFGINPGEVRVDWSRVIDRKERFTRSVTAGTEESLKNRGIDLIQGRPHFVATNEMEVNGQHLQAEGILIATGSTPRRLTFEGAELMHSSDEILALRQPPQSLLIVGAGVVGMEFGQVFARLGSKVTMITPDPRALLEHEPEIVDALLQFSKDELNIDVFPRTNMHSIRREGDAFKIEVESDGRERNFEADYILNAAGRPPSIDDLALEAANIERNARGVVVDDFLRSRSNRQVFAAGDAHGRMQLSPVASYEGRVAARNFLEDDVERVSYDSIPSIVFTVPPLAMVGWTETAARERGYIVSAITSDMKDWKVFAIAGETIARAKVIIDSHSGRVLGAHLFGKGTDEDIHIFAMAIRFGIAADELRSMVYGYPTFASALPYTLPEAAAKQWLRKTG
jgi:glutathione reductase (NADPH)